MVKSKSNRGYGKTVWEWKHVVKLATLVCMIVGRQSPLSAVTLVYNVKIRRALSTEALTLGSETKTMVLASAVPLFYLRKRHILDVYLGEDSREKVTAYGALFDVRLVTPHCWWLEITTGLEHQAVSSKGTYTAKISGTGLDDIVVSGGKNLFFKNQSQLAAYGIAGFPVKKEVTPGEKYTTLVGSRFFGIGAGLELSHAFIKEQHRSVVGIFQTRFMHFFDRKWDPILPKDATIQPGNVTDLFFVVQATKKANVVDLGYNPTIFTDQGVQFVTGPARVPQVVRNSFYANYTRLAKESFLFNLPGAIGVGFSVSTSHFWDTKTASGWIYVSLLF